MSLLSRVRRVVGFAAGLLSCGAAVHAQQLAVSASAFNFTKGSSATPLPFQSLLAISNSGTSTLTGLGVSSVRYSAGQPTGWVNLGSVSPSSLAAGTSTDLAIATTTTGVAGTFTAQFDVVSSNGGSQTITVRLSVLDANLTATTTSYSLSSSGAPPAAQSFTLTNSGGVTATGIAVSAPTYGVGQPVGWLSVAIAHTSISSGGSAQESFSITGTPSMPSGNYTASFVVSSTNAGSVTFSVALAVSAGTPHIAVSVSSLSFTAVAGNADGTPQSFLVTNSGGGRLTGITARAIYPPGTLNWAGSTGVDSTTAPTTMTVTPHNQNGTFTAGTYTATLLVYSTTSGILDTARVALTLTVSPVSSPPPVASVALQLGSSTLQVGGSTQAIVTLRDASGNVLSGRVITYATSNPAVATVSGSGLVTGVGAGSATITATSEGQSGTATVSVTSAPPAPVASVTVSLGNSTLIVGGQTQAAVTLRDAGGAILVGRTITYSSSSASVATVSTSGLVVANGTGNATITATSEGVSGSAALTVTAAAPPPVATVAVSLGTSSLVVGGQTQTTVTLRDASGAVLTGRSIVFGSTNTSVATVNSAGAVTAVGVGTASITATSENQTGSAPLTVTAAAPAPVASVVVSLDRPVLAIGEEAQATATLKDASGATLSGRTITWASSNALVTRVSSTGRVTAVAAGSATISATSEGQSGVATVTVSEPLPMIVLDQSAVSVSAQASASATSTLAVTNGGGSSLGGLAAAVSATTADGPPPSWLTAKLLASSAPTSLQLTADASRLAPGTYRALVTVSSSASPAIAPASATITFVVTEPPATIIVKDLIATITANGTAALPLEIRQYLDQRGNNNGQFDVGDVLAYFDRTGVAPDRAALEAINAALRRQPAARPATPPEEPDL